MKLFVSLSLLFLLAVVSCKKVDQHSKEKSHVWSQKKSHSGKKYDPEKLNHDKHEKIHHKYSIKHEQHSIEGKQHMGHHEVPKHEAELQKDIKATKKETEDRLGKEEQDLSLQHLTYSRNLDNISHRSPKNSHRQPDSNLKASQHFSHSEGHKVHNHKAQDEKLFVFPESKETKSMQPHSVLEDTFEAVGEEVVQEQPEHPHLKKDSTKNKKSHKKAYEKVKEKTKKKEYEKMKTKDDKKDKKQQYKEKKEKQ